MPSSLILLALAVSAGVGCFALYEIQQVKGVHLRLKQARRRQRLLATEAARAAQRRENYELVAKTAQSLAGAMLDDGSKAARNVHQEIANVPFDILESIPATRDTTKVVRGVHDAIADVSYGSVGLFGKLVKRPKKEKPGATTSGGNHSERSSNDLGPDDE